MAITFDSLLKLPKSKKILILVIILVAITGLYAYLFYLPYQEEMERLKREYDKLTRELNESRAIVRDLQKFKEEIEKLNAELIKALTQLPNEKEIPEILRNISSLGKESNLEFTLFKPKPEEPMQFYAKVPIELVVVGSYHDTGAFFDKVSKLPRIINVVDFNMSRFQKEKDPKKIGTEIFVKTSCLVNTYRFIEKKKEEKVEIKAPKKK